MIITPEIFALVFYNEEFDNLNEKAKEYCLKNSGFEIPSDSEDIEKLKNFLQPRLIVCGCGLVEIAYPYFSLVKKNGIWQAEHTYYKNFKENYIEHKFNFNSIVKKINQYKTIQVCCKCGVTLEENGTNCFCPSCKEKYINRFEKL